MKKIFFNGMALNSEFSGVQYYAENLLRAFGNLPPTYHISFCASSGYAGSVKTTKQVEVLRTAVSTHNRWKRIYFENIHLPRVVQDGSYNLLHSPNYILPARVSIPSVVTVHDLISKDFPQYAKIQTVLYHQLLQKASIKRANQIIAVSHTVKRDILRHYKIADSKITVVHESVGEDFKRMSTQERKLEVLRKYNLQYPYILFVGNLEPKKNLVRLIEAFSRLKEKGKFDHDLIIAGKKGWKYNAIFNAARCSKFSRHIRFIGYVDQSDLPALYQAADLFVFPSLYEGFGIPPLEAMASNVPVIVSNAGSLPEITGGKCPQVDPYDVQQLTDAMAELLLSSAKREQVAAAGREWVKRFSWERAATETLSVYDNIIA